MFFFIDTVTSVIHKIKFKKRCNEKVSIPTHSLYDISFNNFVDNLKCAEICAIKETCLGYMFTTESQFDYNCIHLTNIYNCSYLSVETYTYYIKVSS